MDSEKNINDIGFNLMETSVGGDVNSAQEVNDFPQQMEMIFNSLNITQNGSSEEGKIGGGNLSDFKTSGGIETSDLFDHLTNQDLNFQAHPLMNDPIFHNEGNENQIAGLDSLQEALEIRIRQNEQIVENTNLNHHEFTGDSFMAQDNDNNIEEGSGSEVVKKIERRKFPLTIKPAKKAFTQYTKSQQKRLVMQVIEAIQMVAGDEVELFMDVLRRKTDFGSENCSGKDSLDTLNKVVQNIGCLYTNCPSEHKPDVLSLVAKEFSNSQLVNLGFKELSRAKYNYSVYNKNPNNASLAPYKRFIPASRTKLSDQVQSNILQTLLKFGKLTNQNCPRQLIPKIEDPGFKPDKIYHLKAVVREIFDDHNVNFNDKMSLTTFSHYIPKNFIKLNKIKTRHPGLKDGLKAKESQP